MSVTRRKIHAAAAAAAALAVLLCVTGCGVDLGQIVSEKVSEVVGEDVGITLGAGPTCMPEWVNHPDTESANQGMKVPGGELCVSSWFLDEADGFDANQSLPEMADDSDFEQLAEFILPLVIGQLPGPVRSAIGNSDEFKKLIDSPNEFEDLLVFKAYGEGQRALLLLVADGGDVADYQLVIGAFCEGTC